MCTVYTIDSGKMRISLNVDEPTLKLFDQLWQIEGWESRQEAIVFLIRQAIARGYISKEKYDALKALKGGKG